MCAGRGDVDDAAPAGIDHVGQYRLDAVEDTVEVDVDDPLPVLERDFIEPLELLQSGCVHQNRHRAELGVDGVEGGVNLRPVGDVGDVGVVGVRRIEVQRRDIHAV